MNRLPTPWEKRCLRVAADFGVGVYFLEDDPAAQHEEDGFLHILKPGEQHAVFDLASGQRLNLDSTNTLTGSDISVKGKVAVEDLPLANRVIAALARNAD